MFLNSGSESSGSEDDKEYEVQKIIGYKSEDSNGDDCEMYLVKWNGYETEDATWEPEENLTDPQVVEKIKNFKMAEGYVI